MENVLYAELTPKEFRARLAAAPIAYLPLGTLEWHGEHLPLGADGLQSQGFFVELARKAGGIVLPMLFLGPDRRLEKDGRTYYGMDILGFSAEQPRQLAGSAYWCDDDLFGRLLDAILLQLARAGFRVVVGHGHGPSTGFFRDHAAEYARRHGLELFICWRDDESDGCGIQTDHAAANETSLMLALRPDLVQMQNLDPNPAVWPTAVGGKDPRTEASTHRGRKAIALQIERMTGILQDALARLRRADG